MMKFSKKTKFAWLLFIILLLVSLLAEYVILPEPAKEEFHIENTTFFYAWFGFFSCVLIIIVSKILGLFLKRREDYYKEANNGN